VKMSYQLSSRAGGFQDGITDPALLLKAFLSELVFAGL
jgi:hypothetical protein